MSRRHAASVATPLGSLCNPQALQPWKFCKVENFAKVSSKRFPSSRKTSLPFEPVSVYAQTTVLYETVAVRLLLRSGSEVGF
jgi:hypothetical protein